MNASCEVDQPKKKRLVTEARRQQSRAAQRRYREKQKRRLAELSFLASANQFNEPSNPAPIPSDLLEATWLPTANEDFDLGSTGFSADAQDRGPPPDELSGVDSSSITGGIPVESNWATNLFFGGSDTYQANYTSLSNDSMLDRRRGRDSRTASASAYLPLSAQVTDNDELPEIMRPSEPVLSSAFTKSLSFSTNAMSPPSIPRDTYIRVHRCSLLNSFKQNAMMLGYTLDWVTTYGCHLNSLWCPTLPEPQSQVGVRVSWRENIPEMMKMAPDLAPTVTQLQHPHLLYIDIFPFPDFREKMLALRAVQPKVFEEEDFMRDIDAREAMCCWGPTPWEKRSWEVQPWFLRKWWMLTGGEEGEMGSLSRWWRRFRGEEM